MCSMTSLVCPRDTERWVNQLLLFQLETMFCNRLYFDFIKFTELLNLQPKKKTQKTPKKSPKTKKTQSNKQPSKQKPKNRQKKLNHPNPKNLVANTSYMSLCLPYWTGIFPFIYKCYHLEVYNTSRHKLTLNSEKSLLCQFQKASGRVLWQWTWPKSYIHIFWVAAACSYRPLLSESHWLPAETMWGAHRKRVIRLQCFLVAGVSCKPWPCFAFSNSLLESHFPVTDLVHFSHEQLDLKTSHWPICS